MLTSPVPALYNSSSFMNSSAFNPIFSSSNIIFSRSSTIFSPSSLMFSPSSKIFSLSSLIFSLSIATFSLNDYMILLGYSFKNNDKIINKNLKITFLFHFQIEFGHLKFKVDLSFKFNLILF